MRKETQLAFSSAKHYIIKVFTGYRVNSHGATSSPDASDCLIKRDEGPRLGTTNV